MYSFCSSKFVEDCFLWWILHVLLRGMSIMQLLGEMFYKCQFNKLVDTVVQIIYISYFLPTYSINYWVFSVLLVFVSCNLKLLGVNTFRMVPVSLPVSSIKKTFSEFSAYLSECLVGFIEKNPITVQNPPILHLQGLNPLW